MRLKNNKLNKNSYRILIKLTDFLANPIKFIDDSVSINSTLFD